MLLAPLLVSISVFPVLLFFVSIILPFLFLRPSLLLSSSTSLHPSIPDALQLRTRRWKPSGLQWQFNLADPPRDCSLLCREVAGLEGNWAEFVGEPRGGERKGGKRRYWVVGGEGGRKRRKVEEREKDGVNLKNFSFSSFCCCSKMLSRTGLFACTWGCMCVCDAAEVGEGSLLLLKDGILMLLSL